ncbi:MAG: hypothetical protein CMJ59_24715 [Planctomycetaceae bacterium]|nr:hypothetical protein [Planctomycetaceae bacterium]
MGKVDDRKSKIVNACWQSPMTLVVRDADADRCPARWNPTRAVDTNRTTGFHGQQPASRKPPVSPTAATCLHSRHVSPQQRYPAGTTWSAQRHAGDWKNG